MKIHNEYMTVQTKQKREFMNITPNVKSGLEKSGIHDGIVLVATLHSNAAVFLNDEEVGLQEDIDKWLNQVAPERDDYKHKGRFESNAGVHLQGLLLNSGVSISISDGKLNLGPWQYVMYADLDGMRPKRILMKYLGE